MSYKLSHITYVNKIKVYECANTHRPKSINSYKEPSTKAMKIYALCTKHARSSYGKLFIN